MPEAAELAAIDARLTELRLQREALQYVDDFAFWGAQSRAIDAEVRSLQARRAELTRAILQRQPFQGSAAAISGHV
ncbi:hypothetical protein [Methylobacterium nodulans]|uniref:Uncharacterized protein n=1 Tax=Methylobacterium nodulans (strain LMG 21967 / CNCM I-2342 / ORS 2060) TaxID=460265 RepID=B8ILV2_METNO|nr:hypothetical protein [Methylobacterium nodulans]ACL62077.1 hypothetical protein Mnod_7338 [Methylobacterium nodulans ORS 2060]